jgi:uncharacterized Zn-binding protein involved in type VI secretion
VNDNDEVRDSSVRKEIDSNGRPVRTAHDTVVRLTRGLKPFFTIGGKPVAVVGSGGDNASPDHALPKEGQVLVPLPAAARVVGGVDWFTVDGAPVAVASSTVRVPDAEKAEKSDVLRVNQVFLRADGQPVARGNG